MEETFKTIALFQYSSEAQIIKGLLESEGITVYMSDNLTIDIDPLVSNAIGGIKLKVSVNQEKEAIKILKTIDKYSVNDEGEKIKCPKCKSEKVELFSRMNTIKSFFWIIFSFLVSVLPFYTRHKYICEECKNEFDIK